MSITKRATISGRVTVSETVLECPKCGHRDVKSKPNMQCPDCKCKMVAVLGDSHGS
jgi:Zn finger protein HypA/HybF involved in hydrogenase expression